MKNNFSCRHGVFAKYFGDEPPPCKKQCDVCKNKMSVQKQIDTFYERITQYKTTALRVTDDDGELYGGGRQGQRTENEYYSENEGPSNDAKAKKQLEAVIKKQFQFRKASDMSPDADEAELEKYSRVKAASSTRVKVNGLKVSVSNLTYYL